MVFRLLSRQNPEPFLKISRSVRIAGHSTSVRLESAFWSTLEDIATVEGMTISSLISLLYQKAIDQHDDVPSLTSMLRTICLLYQEERSSPGIQTQQR
ncbi:ribbon-helix-helix domain-containing protein [Brucella grignonensis]|uniref:ribbon-helix-helix domain-containing protein n=1 Tax=Brucella grignonensis TaxID=94627 RepID=UPI0026BC1A57